MSAVSEPPLTPSLSASFQTTPPIPRPCTLTPKLWFVHEPPGATVSVRSAGLGLVACQPAWISTRNFTVDEVVRDASTTE